ncbi:rho GTPase-activating protein 44-like isoform X2 [Dreissena polymorpha]|uniref:rho GTPase-activating protein 44-like isoform X2 n=1 Tax=Dreissena polymorpha TaxID=45954 RepID=UPI0022647B63|nr:rho GTPase-activating protein 44-like isoform X2 [Dreissena polymorpha]
MFKKENLRKNFLRVKQTAEQKIGRSEKTEVLSDDLQTAEKRVELLKQVSSNTYKKLSSSLLVANTSASDADKRLKKMPEAGLGHGMVESASTLGTEFIIGQMYQMCGECQTLLAKNHLEYEQEIEKTVLEPIHDIIENEIPNIAKLKKALNKVTLDMDSAKNRWNSAVRQTQTPGVNMQAAAQKVDAIKDELDEANTRVDQAKDAYTTGLFSFISRESEHSQNLLSLLQAQAKYHQSALDMINAIIPRMQESLLCNPVKPVYGMALEEHLRCTNRDIAQVIEACVCYLLECGIEEEGLFRIAGMANKVKKLKASFDAGFDLDDTTDIDPHTVASALKQYLRELPEPLLTFQKFPEFMAAAQLPAEQRLQALWVAVDHLPKPNYDNFRYLVKFLSKLREKSDINKMTPGNIAIVIGPNLIWSEGDSGQNMMNTGILSLITELIVQHADWFFPGDQNFTATARDCAPEHKSQQRPLVTPKSGQREVKSVFMGSTNAKPAPPQRSRSQSAVGLACTGTVSSTPNIPDSSSSETNSLSEESQDLKAYEGASTLERKDNVDRFSTASGDLSLDSAKDHNSTATKPPKPVISPFNPNERKMYRTASTKKSPAPKPRAESVPNDLPSKQPAATCASTMQNVHSEMYSTAFALQSLGNGGNGKWPEYLSTVRNMWDDKLHESTSNSGGQGRARSDQEVNFGGYSGENSPQLNKSSSSSEPQSLEKSTSNQSSTGSPFSSPPVNQEARVAMVTSSTLPPASRSPSVSPNTSSSHLSGAPLAESEDLQVPGSLQRRVTRKPAPPPPPERPHSVAVTASFKPLAAAYQTWPRQAATPIAEDEDNIEKGSEIEETRAEKPERPHPPDRVSSLPHGASHMHSDRPKIPPPLVPPSHKRSASTGAPVTIPGNGLQCTKFDSTSELNMTETP